MKPNYRAMDLLLRGLHSCGTNIDQLHHFLESENEHNSNIGIPIISVSDFDTLLEQVKSKAEPIAIPIQFRLSNSPDSASRSYYHTLDKINKEVAKIPSKGTLFDNLVLEYIESMLKND